MPDMVAFLRPDGLVTHHLGGRRLPFVREGGSLAGRRLEDVLPPELSALIIRLVRRAISTREECEQDFSIEGANYQVRTTPQSPDRALCIVRQLSVAPAAAAAPDSGGSGGRRSFMRRFQRSIAEAALRERPLALCLVFLDGLSDIGRLLDFALGERILAQTLAQLPENAELPEGGGWYVGQLGEALLGVVIEGTADRDRIRAVAGSLCEAIARPIQVEDATFHLAPSAGVAILGEDASRPPVLLDHARAAMLESRRSGPGSVQFYSDTLRMLPVARLDIERELRTAIAEGQFSLHYKTRHGLADGAVAGIQASMRWVHPLRGEIPPSEFLPIAEATGLASSISRAVLERLVVELPALSRIYGPQAPVSFGALRQHITSRQLLEDCRRLAAAGHDFLSRLELRISERTLATLNGPERTLAAMAESGARLVVDEMGRGYSSLAQLPRLPLSALQIDREFVVASARSPAALCACRAMAALAAALGIPAIATGIDDEAARARMAEAGCTQGLGDLYPAAAVPAMQLPRSSSVRA